MACCVSFCSCQVYWQSHPPFSTLVPTPAALDSQYLQFLGDTRTSVSVFIMSPQCFMETHLSESSIRQFCCHRSFYVIPWPNTEAIPKNCMHHPLSSLASAFGLKARINTRCWFHMCEHPPNYVVEHTQPANALLAEDRLNLLQPRK